MKLKVSIGSNSLDAEGPVEFIAEQRQWFEQQIAGLEKTLAEKVVLKGGEEMDQVGNYTGSLAGYLKEKGGQTSQVRRFLLTANWLRMRGAASLETGVVTKTLRDNQQSKLSNPADCLNKLVGQGLCEKQSTGFFITPEGLESIEG